MVTSHWTRVHCVLWHVVRIGIGSRHWTLRTTVIVIAAITTTMVTATIALLSLIAVIFGNTVHRSTDWYKNAHMHHLGPCFSVMYSILYSFFPNLNMHHSNNSAAVVTSPPKMSKSTNVHNSDLYMYCGIFPCSYILYRYDALGDVVMQFPIATIMTATKKYVFDCSLGTITRSKVPNQWEEIHNCLE